MNVKVSIAKVLFAFAFLYFVYRIIFSVDNRLSALFMNLSASLTSVGLYFWAPVIFVERLDMIKQFIMITPYKNVRFLFRASAFFAVISVALLFSGR